MREILEVLDGVRITEEGLATLNTYYTFPNKSLFSQAVRYFAVCRGTELGFVELFKELTPYVPDEKKRFNTDPGQLIRTLLQGFSRVFSED